MRTIEQTCSCAATDSGSWKTQLEDYDAAAAWLEALAPKTNNDEFTDATT